VPISRVSRRLDMNIVLATTDPRNKKRSRLMALDNGNRTVRHLVGVLCNSASRASLDVREARAIGPPHGFGAGRVLQSEES